MKVVLISGKAQHGKDTFADFFRMVAERHSKKCLTIRYGDMLKFVAKQYYDWNGEKDLAGRTLLQTLGTDIVRKNNENAWVNCVMEIVVGLKTEFDYVLIPDARFENEIENWKDTNIPTISVRVNRYDNNLEPFDNKLSKEQREHPSEVSLDNYDKFDYVVKNVTETDLLQEAKNIYEELEKFD